MKQQQQGKKKKRKRRISQLMQAPAFLLSDVSSNVTSMTVTNDASECLYLSFSRDIWPVFRQSFLSADAYISSTTFWIIIFTYTHLICFINKPIILLVNTFNIQNPKTKDKQLHTNHSLTEGTRCGCVGEYCNVDCIWRTTANLTYGESAFYILMYHY